MHNFTTLNTQQKHRTILYNTCHTQFFRILQNCTQTIQDFYKASRSFTQLHKDFTELHTCIHSSTKLHNKQQYCTRLRKTIEHSSQLYKSLQNITKIHNFTQLLHNTWQHCTESANIQFYKIVNDTYTTFCIVLWQFVKLCRVL